jgi:hypothetical protein
VRRISHITARYVGHRLALKLYELTHPNQPWLSADAIGFLACWLRTADCALEFGSGRSTIWFASRIRQLISVEHDAGWYSSVAASLRAANLSQKVTLLHRSEKATGSRDSPYLEVLSAVDEHSLDFCLVDGVSRDLCALRAIPRIKRGGLLIIDNANWYLPSDSFSPDSVPSSSPCASSLWADFSNEVTSWRRFWTSNGVTDTAIFFKP